MVSGIYLYRTLKTEFTMNIKSDSLEEKILNLIQSGFPITRTPYDDMGKQLNVSGTVVLDVVKKLVQSGVLRKVGPFYNTRELGFASLLCAAKVEESRIDAVAEMINQYPEITHNYKRAHEHNLWFTVIAHSNERIQEILTEIETNGKLDKISQLPAEKIFKVKVDLKVN